MIDHKRKFIHVAIPKTASISLTQALGMKIKDEPALYHNTLEHYISADYPNNILYHKFSIVRNPWSRLASLWRDFTRLRVQQYSGWHKTSDLLLLSEFKDFEDMCLNLKDSLWSQNLFFKPQVYFLSYAGEIKMDYIGRFEELNKSYSQICKNLNEIPSGMVRTRSTIGPKPEKYYRRFYTNKSAQAVHDFYKLDIENFNYEF